ncbi:MAG: SPOR domain-containing protein [Rhodobacteraceae bacterium]|nr:MAG: SPOR domain-containing protein [Paracoccaceae bacterium]
MPAEFPPDSFEERQYVDSKGCVFVRVGVDDAVTWVPRVSRTRQQICGQQPTFEVQPQIVEDASEPASPPDVAVAAVTPQRQTARRATVSRVSAPIDVSGIRPPKGYRPAWTDGRLNPNRAKGTAAGEAAMDRIWTREVPRKLRPGAARQVRTSSKSGMAAAAPVLERAAKQVAFVQVGIFGVPGNTKATVSRLKALGVPVEVRAIRSKGRALQSVVAGPFATATGAQSALGQIRSAGYRDAFLRR